MLEGTLLETMREMLLTATSLMLPPLLAALLVGLVVGLIQAITSVQEQTLSFVPKILAVVLVFVLLGAWMMQRLVDFGTELFGGLADFGAL